MKKVEKERSRRVTGYRNTIITLKNTAPRHRIMIGLPMTGLVRSEWVMAKYGQIIPCNWSQMENLKFLPIDNSPLNFLVADARNLIVRDCLATDTQWLFFIDSDVVLPPHATLAVNDYIRKGKVPIMSGLYFTKGFPSEPLIYRGRGNSYFDKWKIGDKVWVDGIGMGCTLIHRSILQVLSDTSEEYSPVEGETCRKIFETPAKIWYDPQNNTYHKESGTEDLFFLSRVMKEGVFKKAGWPKYEKMQYPILCDTGIFCYHIDNNGVKYPANNEWQEFVSKGGIKKFREECRKGF